MNAFRFLLAVLLVAQSAACAAAENMDEPAAAPAKPKPAPPRRVRPAVPERMPVPPAPAPAVPAPVIPAPSAVGPSPPTPLTSCDAGGCWSGGSRYQGGAGDTYLDRNGRPCQKSGNWMQCF